MGSFSLMDSQDDDNVDDFFQFGAGDLDPEPVTDIKLRVPPRLGLLAKLSIEEFDDVARAAQLKFFEADKVVFEQGDTADRFFILVDGQVSVIRDGETVATLKDGAFFGESALFVHGVRTAGVRTITPCSLWSVDYSTFEHVVADHLMADDDARSEVQDRIGSIRPK